MALRGEADPRPRNPSGKWRLLGVGTAVGLICFLVWWFIPVDFYVFYSLVRPQLASPRLAPKLQVAAALPLTVILWFAIELFQRSRRGQVLSLRWCMKFPLALLAMALISAVILVGHAAAKPEPGELYNPVTAMPNYKWYRDESGKVELSFAWWRVSPLGEPLQNLTPQIAREWDRQQRQSRQSPAQSSAAVAVQAHTVPVMQDQVLPRSAVEGFHGDVDLTRPRRMAAEGYTQVSSGFRFQLKACHSQPSEKLICDLLITNLEEDGPLTLVAGPDRNGYDYPISRIIDESGKASVSYLARLAESKGVHGGGGPYAASSVASASLIGGVPVAAKVGFLGVTDQASSLAVLEVVYVTGRWGSGNMKLGKIQFQQVQVNRGENRLPLEDEGDHEQ